MVCLPWFLTIAMVSSFAVVPKLSHRLPFRQLSGRLPRRDNKKFPPMHEKAATPRENLVRKNNRLFDPSSGRYFSCNESPPVYGTYEGDHLYGISPVFAALRCSRRKIEELLMQEGLASLNKKQDHSCTEILRGCKERNIPVRTFSKHDLNMLTDNKPHQGFVLRAAPLTFDTITELPPSSSMKSAVRCVLALDEVWDPQNFGALLRSSHFLGCDDVIVCAKNSAPLSPAVSKASAGAMEIRPVKSTENMMRFLDNSKSNGWQVVGAALGEAAIEVDNVPLDRPTILVLGNEGHGIRTNVLTRCDYLVRIARGGLIDLVDSLNVSVCGGILLHSILKRIRQNMRANQRIYTVSLLCVTIAFLFADQNLLAPNLTAIAQEFHFNDAQRDHLLGGQIALGFFIIGGVVSIIAGYFADLFNRCHLFSMLVTFGESACFATYWVRTYEQLYVCRVLTGVSIGGATPVMFSLLGDVFPGTSRVLGSTYVGISMSTGIAVGQFVAGLAGPAYGWRSPFLIIATPALICAALVFFTAKEPSRGSQEEEVLLMRRRLVDGTSRKVDDIEDDGCEKVQRDFCDPNSTSLNVDYSSVNGYNPLERPLSGESHSVEESLPEVDYSEKIDCSKLNTLLSTPSVLLIFLQGIPGCLPWGMIYTFLNDYLSEDRGLSVFQATVTLTVFGVGSLVGQLCGGYWGQKLYNRDPRFQCVLMGVTTLVSVPPMLFLLNTNNPGNLVFNLMSFFLGVSVNVNGPNVRTVLQNVCSPEIRGTAFAFFNLTDDIGKGAGPALVVLFIRAFHGNRQKAFNAVTMFWLLCGVFLLVLICTVPKDEIAVQQHVRDSLLRLHHRLHGESQGDHGRSPKPIHLSAASNPILGRDNSRSSEVIVQIDPSASDPTLANDTEDFSVVAID